MTKFAIAIKDSDLKSYTKSKLLKAGYSDFTAILECTGFNTNDFSMIATEKVLDAFLKNAQLEGFGKKSREDMARFLEGMKKKVLDAAFESFFKDDQTLDDDNELNDEDELEIDVDLDSLLPTETLLINTLLVKGDTSPTPIEDVIEDLEIEIYEELEEEEISPRRLSLLLAEKVLGSDWLTDTPIYASPEACKTYPNIISALSRKAVLVLRGT